MRLLRRQQSCFIPYQIAFYVSVGYYDAAFVIMLALFSCLKNTALCITPATHFHQLLWLTFDMIYTCACRDRLHVTTGVYRASGWVLLEGPSCKQVLLLSHALVFATQCVRNAQCQSWMTDKLNTKHDD